MSCEQCRAYAGTNYYCLNGYYVETIAQSMICDDFEVRGEE